MNARDNNGSTPFIHAAVSNYVDMTEIMKLLLSNGADPFIRNNDGNNALDKMLTMSFPVDSGVYQNFLFLLELGLVKELNPEIKPTFEDDYEQDFEDALNEYDIDAVKKFLEEGIDEEEIKNFAWHFVNNFLPEAEDKSASQFKARLDKGSEILRLLHEVLPEIPTHDPDGIELSYTRAIEVIGRDDVDDEDFLPLKNNTIAKLRRAVSPLALAELLNEEVDVNAASRLTAEKVFDKLRRIILLRDFEPDENETLHDVIAYEIVMEDSCYDVKNDLDPADYMIVGTTMLHIIARNFSEYFNPAEMIKMLCEAGAGVNLRDISGSTPLVVLVEEIDNHGASEISHVQLECICEFIKAGADFDINNEKGMSFRKFITGKYYTDEGKFEDEIRGSSWVGSFLKEALFIDIIQSFLKCDSWDTKLLIASFGNDAAKILQALSHGADIQVRTQKGYSPILLASMFGTEETIKVLLENGADINDRDKIGNNVITLAIMSEEKVYGKVEILLRNGADINSQNFDGVTPLMFAVKTSLFSYDFGDKLAFLLSHGANLDMKSHDGKCALTLAVESRDFAFVKQLLLAGADPAPVKVPAGE